MTAETTTKKPYLTAAMLRGTPVWVVFTDEEIWLWASISDALVWAEEIVPINAVKDSDRTRWDWTHDDGTAAWCAVYSTRIE